MKNAKLFSSFMLLGSMFLYSCFDDTPSPDADISAVVLIEDLESIEADIEAEFDELSHSEGLVSMEAFSLYAKHSETVHIKTEGIQTALDLGLEEGEFDLDEETASIRGGELLIHLWNDYKGSFTWNAEKEDWDFEAGEELVVFNFPAVQGSEDNNAQLVLRDVQSVEIEWEGHLKQRVSRMEFDLSLNENEVLSHVVEVDYSSKAIVEEFFSRSIIGSYDIERSAAFREGIFTSVTVSKNEEVLMSTELSLSGQDNGSKDELFLGNMRMAMQLKNYKFLIEADLGSWIEENFELLIQLENTENLDEAIAELNESINQYFAIVLSTVEPEAQLAEGRIDVFINEDLPGGIADQLEMNMVLVFNDGTEIGLDEVLDMETVGKKGVQKSIAKAILTD